MKRREKIILLVAVLMGVYGLADYFLLSGGSDGSQVVAQMAEQELETYVSTASARLAVASIKDRGHTDYLISKAEADWTRDPFRAELTKAVEDAQPVSDAKDAELVYSGFIRAGSLLLGVVNGMEYRSGEMLNELGYKVEEITPAQVVLRTEANKEIILYLEEN
ncbi:MAG: hypothetical protein JEZ12_07515 [Desulfobacterium sp.]|nr:hypothetical protein [Desulfobacterium sp.]